MNATAQPALPDSAAREAVVVGVAVAAGHDGTAEMVVSVQYENGVTAPVILDEETGLQLMKACGAASLDGLIGRPWRELLKGL